MCAKNSFHLRIYYRQILQIPGISGIVTHLCQKKTQTLQVTSDFQLPAVLWLQCLVSGGLVPFLFSVRISYQGFLRQCWAKMGLNCWQVGSHSENETDKVQRLNSGVHSHRNWFPSSPELVHGATCGQLSKEISCNNATLLRFRLQTRHGFPTKKICLNHQPLTTEDLIKLHAKL